jgi:hypothetical protein
VDFLLGDVGYSSVEGLVAQEQPIVLSVSF